MTAGTETGRCGMMRNAKWALGSGLQLLGSEFQDGRWTVSDVKPAPITRIEAEPIYIRNQPGCEPDGFSLV